MNGDMKRVDSWEKIDLSDWQMGYGDLDKILCEAFREALENMLEERPPHLSLPIVWAPNSDGGHGPAVTDAATIYLHLPFDIGGDGECTWAISLEGLVIDYFEMKDQVRHRPHPDLQSTATLFANRLREIANKLDPPRTDTPP